MKIDFSNAQISPDTKGMEPLLEKIKGMDEPDFEKSKPDLEYIRSIAQKYAKYKNIILIANGGSRTSAYAFYNSLFRLRNDVNFEFLTSCEPDWINQLKEKYSPEDTLVIPISKSGDNINNIEPLMSFLDYPVLAITGDNKNALHEIAEKMGWEIVIHPEVGGRFSAMTNCGLVPAALMGLDIEKIYKGAKAGYEKYSGKKTISENPALELAAYFFELEKGGYDEIFASAYSLSLSGFLPLMIQLVHESAGKGNVGQSIFGDYSPESQHHTIQRFFGGKKNMAGLFLYVENPADDFAIKIPEKLKGIGFKSEKLEVLDSIKAGDTMLYEMKGIVGHCTEKKIPAIEILLDKVSFENIGEMIVFWQYFSIYSAVLRSQDPYNQPEVERGKVISFDLRLKK